VPSFDLVGRQGVKLDKRWATHPDAFFSVQVDGMPNYFIYNGPNPLATHGSLHANLLFVSDYILKWVNKIATEDIK
jgi:hypothetical protein